MILEKIYLFVLTFVVLGFYQSVAFAESVILTVGEWPPYIQKGSIDKGSVSTILTRAFKASGVDVELEFKPWKRVELEINSGKGISYGWIKTKDREEKWIYSDKLFSGIAVFAVLKGNNDNEKPDLDKLSTLKNKIVGVTRGYSYGENFDAKSSGLNIEVASTDLQNLGMLIRGRIDAFVVDYDVGRWLLKNNFGIADREKIEFLYEKPVAEYAFHAVCSKNFSQCVNYIDKLNFGLRQLEVYKENTP